MRLDDFYRGQDLLQVFREYLDSRDHYRQVGSSSQRLLRATRVVSGNRSLSGVVETGEYGFESTLYDVDRDHISYQRSASDAELLPFFFIGRIPARRNEGVLLVERKGRIGIRGTLLDDFKDYFKSRFRGLDVEINPLVPQQILDHYLQEGKIKKVRLVRFAIPHDIASAFDAGGHIEKSGSMELSVTAGRGGTFRILDNVRSVLEGASSVVNMFEIHDYEYDTVKVEIDISGSRKTIDLSDVAKLRAYYDITSEVQIGEDGHPVFESISTIASAYMDGLMDALGSVQIDVR